jgi:DNA repair protein RecO (recombination protein O)
MRVDQQPAFVLHARPWRETSLIIEALTRDYGRVGLVARGVRTARSRFARASLQPLTPVSLSWSGRGELSTLFAAEAAGAVLQANGETLLCALYLNELVARLVPRNDPHPEIFEDYFTTFARLAEADSPAWTLRRFERDLLAHLGYGLVLEGEAETGDPLLPDTDYAYRFEHGPVPWQRTEDGLKLRGSALMALAQDREPASAEDMASLRRLLRALIFRHLDGVELRAWNLFGSLRSTTNVVPSP